MAVIENPVLTGFNPDPSLLRVGDDYYIATSTFEWYPGVQIHHSLDLVNWTLITRPLRRKSQINLAGDKNSGGLWAPCLSWSKGVFYLIYTDVKMFGNTFYDVKNYLVTAEDIMGEWSDPVFLNSSGFDPSLFHDGDGRKWLLNMNFDYRTWKNRFAGIVMQEYSEAAQRLIGEPKLIFAGTGNRITEGPHVYKKDGYYYLFCAEGGTVYEHCEIVARSRNLEGPYEISPHNPLITSRPYPLNSLQKAGHVSLAEGRNGKWYMAHLCGRPVGEERYCILGRETAIQEVVWENGWPKLAHGTNEPMEKVEVDSIGQCGTTAHKRNGCWRDEFDAAEWHINFQSLRVPLEERASLGARSGWLRLYGKESLESFYEQTLLAARQQHFCVQADTRLEYAPVSYQQTAGLVYYYDTYSHYYICITRDEQKGRVITLMQKVLNQFSMPIGVGISIPEEGAVYLRLVTERDKASFWYSTDGRKYEQAGTDLDAAVLSDEYYAGIGENRFTGAFIGICCQDISGRNGYADFDYFEYKELDS